MATFSIAAAADDGCSIGTGTWYSASGQPLFYGNAFGSDYAPGMRFTGVTVANGATITSATLAVNVTTAPSPGVTMTCDGDDVDNSGALSSSHMPLSGWTATTAATSGITSLNSTGSKTIDVTAIVQEIVNRAGWASGNALSLRLIPTSASATGQLDSYETSGSNLPKLTVTVAAAAYTLTASGGSATATGVSGALKAARSITASAGAATAAGVAASVTKGYPLTGSEGGATAAGDSAALRLDRKLAGSEGAATAAGDAATLRAAFKLIGSEGAATAAGDAATVRKGYPLVGVEGTATAAGDSADLTYAPTTAYTLTALPGAITAVGADAALTYTPVAAAPQVGHGSRARYVHGLRLWRDEDEEEAPVPVRKRRIVAAVRKAAEPERTRPRVAPVYRPLYVAPPEPKAPQVDWARMVQVWEMRVLAERQRQIDEDDEEVLLLAA